MRIAATKWLLILLSGSFALTVPAFGQSIGVFADAQGTDCTLEIPFPGGAVVVYVVGTLDGPATAGVTAAVFRIAGLPSGWTYTVTPPQQSLVTLGDPFVEGYIVGYQGCVRQGPLVLATIHITPTSAVEHVSLAVVPNLQSPDSCGFEGGHCGRPCARFCSCDDFIVCYCAQGLISTINGDSCSLPVAATTWEQVKLLYD